MDISTEHVRPGVNEPSMHMAQQATHVQQHAYLPTQCNMFFSGYMDCLQEALWYLTEVEKLPLDHPMVVGLKMNLYEQYRILHLQYMLTNSLHMRHEGEINQTKLDFETKHSMDSTEARRHVIENDANEIVNNCAIQTESVVKSEINVLGHSSSERIENVSRNATEISSDIQEKENAASVSDDSELTPEAHRMAVALAEEIYSLLQSQDDLDITDDEEENIDEGFEEMVDL